MAAHSSTSTMATKPTTKDRSSPLTMGAKLTTRDQVIQKYGRTMLSLEIEFQLNDALQRSHYPFLKNELCVYKRLEGDLKKYGDYVCSNILRVCEKLREKDPSLFYKTKPTSIAQDIINNFQKSDMIARLSLHDVGFLTFKLNEGWMAMRIYRMIKDGISTWAPISRVKRVIIDLAPQDTSATLHWKDIRSHYIRDTLVRMLKYSEVKVSGTMVNQESLLRVKSYVREKEEDISSRNRRISEPPNFLTNRGEVLQDPSNDLAALWYGIYNQKAEWIVYVAPIWQRKYIEKCFATARKFAHGKPPTMSYLGYQTSNDEFEKLASLAEICVTHSKVQSLVKQGMAVRYSHEAVVECTLKYTYLKTHRFSECALNVDEMFDEEGNTFAYLLNTYTRIHSILEKSWGLDKLPNRPQQGLIGKERELALCLLQFTEVIEESFLTLMPHLVCEYLWKLCKNFISYIKVRLYNCRFLLCKATKLVIEKCFNLLGITPESYVFTPPSSHFMSNLDLLNDWPVSRPKTPSSRFELFSMFIGVSHSNFEKGNLFGNITVSDTYGLLSDGWCKFDENDCGHVSYFDHDWHDSVGIYSTSFLYFGNPSSRHSVPFSTSLEIGVHLYVTTKEKDACYQLCNHDLKMDLSQFCNSSRSIKRGTFSIEGNNGYVRIYYVQIKDAVDTSMRFTYEPRVGDLKICGHILAYYGDHTLGGCRGFEKESYKAVVFHTEPSKFEKGELPLKKSRLAVPTNGVLIIEAFLKDVDSGDIIVEGTHKFRPKHKGESSEWFIHGKNCDFNLTVDWIRG